MSSTGIKSYLETPTALFVLAAANATNCALQAVIGDIPGAVLFGLGAAGFAAGGIMQQRGQRTARPTRKHVTTNKAAKLNP